MRMPSRIQEKNISLAYHYGHEIFAYLCICPTLAKATLVRNIFWHGNK